MATDSPKYGQLSAADMEILGAREQAATARALRTGFKPAQGQMVSGWYVKPALTQNLADALMQYNNYKNENTANDLAKSLIKAKGDRATANAVGQAGLSTQPGAEAYDREVTPASTMLVNPEDQATARETQSMFTGQPAPTPMGAQAVVPPTAEAQGNVNANPTNNQYMGTPADMTASDNMPLANAVRNAPLANAVAGANNQSAIPQVVNGQTTNPAIPAANQASADGMLPAVTVRPEPEPAPNNNEATARILRGENPFDARPATIENIPAVTERMPAVKGYNEGDWVNQAMKLYANDQNKEGDAIMGFVKERQVAETSKSNAQMADLKVQREGILNREQARAIATDRIEDNAKREQQRAQDKKDEAESARAFRKDAQAITDATTRRGQDMNAEVRREISANKPEKPLTEYQGKSLAYGLRSQDANDVIEKVGTNYSPLAIDAYKKVEGVPGVGTGAYALLSDTDKQVSQAQRNFVNAVLRQESGAVISKEEFVNAQKQYFPQPGDDATTLQQKSDNRKRVISSFKTSAGRTVEGEFARPPAASAPTSAPMFASNGKARIQSTDGGKTWQEVK